MLPLLCAAALDAAVGAFLQAGGVHPSESERSAKPVPRAIAVDGRTVRGSRTVTSTAHAHGTYLRERGAAFHHLDRPGARQAIRIVRRCRDRSTGKPTIERVCLITGLDTYDATAVRLATWIRGHRGIENLLHHVRDHTRPLRILGLT